MSSDEWVEDLEAFKNAMKQKILDNMKEKHLSWKVMFNIQLQPLVDKYLRRRDWVSAANILFMIWENEQRRRRE